MPLIRLFHISFVLIKYDLDNFIWTNSLFAPFRFLILFFPWRWGKHKTLPRGEAIQKALEELGPIFVKFGQLLSVRRDLLPDDIALSLAKLQDNVPPFDSQVAINNIEKSLGHSVHELFQSFNPIPLAAASIAQIHEATLQNGEKVVIKILRPNIQKRITQDIRLLKTLARFANQYLAFAKRFRIIEVVDEIQNTLYNECDLQREAANASQLRRNFQDSPILHVPKIHWAYTRKDILVMDYIEGVSITDIETLQAHNVDLKLLATRGVEIFFTQVFRDSFFHADMHPGNIFVDIRDPKNPSYIAVDFGIMGTLTPSDQQYIAQSFLAFFKRDYRNLALLHIKSGWISPTTRLDALESALRSHCEPIFEKPLEEISFAKTLLSLFQTAKQFDMQIQPQLLLLQKTLLSIEGLGLQLYPELNLWQTAKPFLEKWIRQKFGPKMLLKNLKEHIPTWIDKLPQLPEAIFDLAQHLKNNTPSYSHPHPTPPGDFKHAPARSFSLFSVRKIAGVGLMICTTLLFIHSDPFHWFSQYGVWIAGMSGLLGLALFIS
ncbi:MAG TPA: ubiquinone biosynthesis regulatory protein kinase UbiB [Gammaproteobacteria bacterium]|nr:ubiquinone biosynthesis regulatory protein kinase UbiB [Gammaproteobacteria bacterium]